MRRTLFLVPLALALLPGCSSLAGLVGAPSTTVGWKVEVGTPSTLTVPATAVVQQRSTATGTIPVTAALAAGSVATSRAAVLAAEAGPCDAAPAPRAVLAQQANGCTLQTVCDKLDIVINRLPPPAQRLPMPAPAGKEE